MNDVYTAVKYTIFIYVSSKKLWYVTLNMIWLKTDGINENEAEDESPQKNVAQKKMSSAPDVHHVFKDTLKCQFSNYFLQMKVRTCHLCPLMWYSDILRQRR